MATGFAYFARKDATRVAIIEPGGRTFTRGEVAHLVNRLSRAFRARGLRPADTLAIICGNCAEYLAAYLAATQIGLYVVPVNWHLKASELAYIIGNSGARAVVIDPFRAPVVRAALDACSAPPDIRLCTGDAPGFQSLADFTQGFSGEPLEDPVTGRTLYYTSATTGMPKGIRRSLSDAQMALDRLLALAEMFETRAGIAPEEGTYLCQSMLYHGAPLECSLAAIHRGNQVVLMRRWTPELALQFIERYSIRTSVMVPAMFIRLLKCPRELRDRYSVKSLRLVAHGAAPCPIDIKRQMIEWWGPILQEMYGASEGAATGVTSQEWLRYPGTVGRAHPGGEIRILDDAGEPVPHGTVGTIYIRPYTGDRFEYLGEQEKTRNAYRGDFFTAGDVGYLNDEGYLFICDRKHDMIITGGVNVYSAEVERSLVLHDSVADCAVFGVPDTLLGEIVMAVVEPLPGIEPSPTLSTDILKFLATKLSPEKMPKRLQYTTALPRDPAGKLFKRHLREPFWADKGRRI